MNTLLGVLFFLFTQCLWRRRFARSPFKTKQIAELKNLGSDLSGRQAHPLLSYICPWPYTESTDLVSFLT